MVVLRPMIRHPFHLFSLGSIVLRRQPPPAAAAAAAAAAIIINSNHRSSPSMMMSSSSSTNTNNDNKNDGRIWIHRPFEVTPASMTSSSSSSQPSSVSMRSCPLPKTTPHSLSKDKIYNIIRPISSSSSFSATKTKTTLLSEQGRPPTTIISPDEIKNMKQIQQSKMEYYKSQFQSRVEDVLTLSSMKRIQRRTIQSTSSSSSSKEVSVTIYFPSEKYNHEKEETTNTDTDVNANTNAKANKQSPLLNGICLHVHGGGWLFGDSYYQVGHRCLEISQSLNVAVVSVEYSTFCDDDDDDNTNFQPVNDVITTIDWIESYGCNELNTHRSFIGSGESSGAHLLLLGILNRRDRDYNNKDREESVLLSSLSSWKCLNLVYGVYDISGTPSVHSDGESSSPLCGKDLLCLYDMYYRYVKTAKQQHTNDDDTNRKHPSMSPLYANLSCLPPVLLTVGTADPLLDDSLFLANKLSSCDAENYVELAIYEGGEHGLGHFGVQEDEEMGKVARIYTLDFMKKYLSE